MRTIVIALLAGALASSAAQAADERNATSAQTFMTEAIQGDLAEIRMGELAQRNAASPSVKQFGEKLVNGHTANLAQAKLATQSLGLSAPTAPNDEQKSMYDQLSKLSGPSFDREFAAHMVEDHKKDIAKFQREAEQQSPTGEFAKLSLPKLQEHLQIAQSLMTSTTGSGR